MPQDRFTELITKEFIGNLTLSDAVELKLLLQDKENREKYDLLKLYLASGETDRSSDESVFKIVKRKILQQEEPMDQGYRIKKRPFYWIMSAAAVLALVFIGVLMISRDKLSVNQLAVTERAAQKSIVLEDGTRVVLNAASKLSYPRQFAGGLREVTLTGEAFFDVTKDSKRPFIIHAGKMDIRVLGTAFNVKSYTDDKYSETTLIRGAVQVTLKDRPSDLITLKPSEKLIVNNFATGKNRADPGPPGEALTQVVHFEKKDTTVLETSWMYNRVAFRDESLAEISKMLERVYNVDIEIQSAEIRNLKFTGSFHKESISEVLKTLSLIEPFFYRVENRRIIIRQVDHT